MGSSAGTKTRIVGVMSAIVVILAIVGLVVGIAFPDGITGAIFPVAAILWFVLYKVMERKNHGRGDRLRHRAARKP